MWLTDCRVRLLRITFVTVTVNTTGSASICDPNSGVGTSTTVAACHHFFPVQLASQATHDHALRIWPREFVLSVAVFVSVTIVEFTGDAGNLPNMRLVTTKLVQSGAVAPSVTELVAGTKVPAVCSNRGKCGTCLLHGRLEVGMATTNRGLMCPAMPL